MTITISYKSERQLTYATDMLDAHMTDGGLEQLEKILRDYLTELEQKEEIGPQDTGRRQRSGKIDAGKKRYLTSKIRAILDSGVIDASQIIDKIGLLNPKVGDKLGREQFVLTTPVPGYVNSTSWFADLVERSPALRA